MKARDFMTILRNSDIEMKFQNIDCDGKYFYLDTYDGKFIFSDMDDSKSNFITFETPFCTFTMNMKNISSVEYSDGFCGDCLRIEFKNSDNYWELKIKD